MVKVLSNGDFMYGEMLAELWPMMINGERRLTERLLLANSRLQLKGPSMVEKLQPLPRRKNDPTLSPSSLSPNTWMEFQTWYPFCSKFFRHNWVFLRAKKNNKMVFFWGGYFEHTWAAKLGGKHAIQKAYFFHAPFSSLKHESSKKKEQDGSRPMPFQRDFRRRAGRQTHASVGHSSSHAAVGTRQPVEIRDLYHALPTISRELRND